MDYWSRSGTLSAGQKIVPQMTDPVSIANLDLHAQAHTVVNASTNLGVNARRGLYFCAPAATEER